MRADHRPTKQTDRQTDGRTCSSQYSAPLPEAELQSYSVVMTPQRALSNAAISPSVRPSVPSSKTVNFTVTSKEQS